MSDSEFQVESNVPLPSAASMNGRKPKYPWTEMDIGDSFFAPHPPGKDHASHRSNLSRAAVQYAKKHPPYKFATRQVDGGVRVWRIA